LVGADVAVGVDVAAVVGAEVGRSGDAGAALHHDGGVWV